MKYGSPDSKYYYPKTDILRNKLDIHDYELLREAESLYTGQRLLELISEPIQGNFDLKHLQSIHYHIFQDLYDFAGKLREEDISKDNTLFAKFQYIIESSNNLFDKLKSDNYLKGLSVVDFSNRAAYYMAEINMIHPFREGNGRTIREFIRCLALNCGYTVDWNCIDKNKLLQASIESKNDFELLARYIKKAIECTFR